ncbi:MAG TPA: hypothetical protein VMX16_06750 [Terriglobia bacterium]|nr:hypothetical protein [Terriglobia bacterium]
MRTSRAWILAGLLIVGLTAAAPAAGATSKDEQEIRGLEQRFAAAVRAKDVDAIMQAYAPGRELWFVSQKCD